MIGMVTLDRRDAERTGHLRPAGGEAKHRYMFLPHWWRQEYATEACAPTLDWFDGALPYELVVLRAQTANGPSLYIAEKLGFAEVERFQEYGAEQRFGVWSPALLSR